MQRAAYVANRAPLVLSKLFTALIRPMVPMLIRSSWSVEEA